MQKDVTIIVTNEKEIKALKDAIQYKKEYEENILKLLNEAKADNTILEEVKEKINFYNNLITKIEKQTNKPKIEEGKWYWCKTREVYADFNNEAMRQCKSWFGYPVPWEMEGGNMVITYCDKYNSLAFNSLPNIKDENEEIIDWSEFC